MTDRLSKTDLINHVAASELLSQGQARRIVDTMLGFITEAVAVGNTVALTGFGTFELRTRAARTGRNPRTGEAVEIAASEGLAFRAAKRKAGA